jgi:hypothetical protein
MHRDRRSSDWQHLRELADRGTAVGEPADDLASSAVSKCFERYVNIH